MVEMTFRLPGTARIPAAPKAEVFLRSCYNSCSVNMRLALSTAAGPVQQGIARAVLRRDAGPAGAIQLSVRARGTVIGVDSVNDFRISLICRFILRVHIQSERTNT